MKNNTTLTTKDLGNTTVNADLNTNLVKLLEIYGQNLQILGHAVTEVNNKVASVEQRLEDVGNFIEELRVDHLELKQLAKVAKNVRGRYKNLFEQKAVLYDVSTHAITKIFDYVMYSMMFEYIDKKKVVLGSNVTSAIALSTKDLTKRELPGALDFLTNFELDEERFNNQLYKKYQAKISKQARWL